MSSGITNREPSQITPGETLYCYEGATIASQGAAPDRSPHRFLVQLPSPDRLKIEYQSGSCDQPLAFTSPIEYER